MSLSQIAKFTNDEVEMIKSKNIYIHYSLNSYNKAQQTFDKIRNPEIWANNKQIKKPTSFKLFTPYMPVTNTFDMIDLHDVLQNNRRKVNRDRVLDIVGVNDDVRIRKVYMQWFNYICPNLNIVDDEDDYFNFSSIKLLIFWLLTIKPNILFSIAFPELGMLHDNIVRLMYLITQVANTNVKFNILTNSCNVVTLGHKLTDRYNSKGVISAIIPDKDIPSMEPR